MRKDISIFWWKLLSLENILWHPNTRKWLIFLENIFRHTKHNLSFLYFSSSHIDFVLCLVPKVGFLVPLSDNLEEDEKSSIPKIPLLEGFNWVGRDCIPVTDKRLSRKHLTVTATSTGSADVLVVLF